MTPSDKAIFTFGAFELDGSAGTLARAGESIPLQAKAFHLLLLLVSQPGEWLSTDGLLQALWPDEVVTKQSVRQAVRRIRTGLGDADPAGGPYLESARTLGYRFIPEVIRRVQDPVVGRDAVLAQLVAGLESGHRLVTLTGAPGTGKTCLARRLLSGSPRSGARHFIDLSGARSLQDVCTAIGEELGVPPSGDPATQLGSAISGRARILLCLDNFEQILHLAGPTVGAWLQAAPEAAFLVTSRRALGLPGEQVVPLSPLSLEPTESSPAVHLFELRARAADPTFSLDALTLPHVVEIARQLDGIPLAIELVAAQTALLGVEQIRARLGRRAGASAPGANPLVRALDASWQLLDANERAALEQACVFERPFTVEAALAVLQLPDDGDIHDALTSLCEHNLLHKTGPHDRPRYAIYVFIREYGVAKMTDVSGLRRRHALHFARHGTRETALRRRREVIQRRLLCEEHHDVLLANAWAIEASETRIAVQCANAAAAALMLLGPFGILEPIIARTLQMPGISRAERVELTLCLGEDRRAQGDAACVDDFEGALELALTAGDRYCLANAQYRLATQRWGAGALAEAASLLEEALQIAHGDRFEDLEQFIHTELSMVLCHSGRLEDGMDHVAEALALAEASGDDWGLARARHGAATLLYHSGRLTEAEDNYKRARAIYGGTGAVSSSWDMAWNLAIVASRAGRFDEAEPLMLGTLKFAEASGRLRKVAVCRGGLAALYWSTGRPAEAKASFHAALTLSRAENLVRTTLLCLSNLAVLHREEGNPSEAAIYARECLAISRERSLRRPEALALTQLGILATQSDDLDAARSSFEEADAILREQKCFIELGKLLCYRGELELRAGRVASARSCLEEASALADERSLPGESGLGLALTALTEQIAAALKQHNTTLQRPAESKSEGR